MQEASVSDTNEFNYSDKYMIAVCGFPTDCEVSNVVVASALHRTYKVRTSPAMVAFHHGGEWCSVKLGSDSDRDSVLSLAKQGINPVFHNRDPHQPSHTLEILAEPPHQNSSQGQPSERHGRRATTHETTHSIIQLSGLPGNEDSLWDGVRLTTSVIASMIHRTYGVRTNADAVVFNENRSKCWIDLSSSIRARKVMDCFEQTRTAPVLHHHSLDQSDPSSHRSIHLSSFLDGEFYSSHILDKLRYSLDQPPSQSQHTQVYHPSRQDFDSKETVHLFGFPGEDPTWRFLTENVIASLLHRNYGIRTSTTGISLSADRQHCQVELSASDARQLVKSINQDHENMVTVFHRDRRVGVLNLSVLQSEPAVMPRSDPYSVDSRHVTMVDPRAQFVDPRTAMSQQANQWYQLGRDHLDIYERDGRFLGEQESSRGVSSYVDETWKFDTHGAPDDHEGAAPPPTRMSSSTELQQQLFSQYQLQDQLQRQLQQQMERGSLKRYDSNDSMTLPLLPVVQRETDEQNLVNGLGNFLFDSSDNLFIS